MLDADWEAELGSNALDMLLVDHFAVQFSEKTGLEDVRWGRQAVGTHTVCSGGARERCGEAA